MEAQLKPLQVDATRGDGRTLTVPDPERMVRFMIRCKGTPMGGEITFECCPMERPTTRLHLPTRTSLKCMQRSGTANSQ